MTATSTARSLPADRPNQVTTLMWAVAGAMVIAIAAIVIALYALTNRQATAATHDPASSSTHTVSDLCFPTHVVHPC